MPSSSKQQQQQQASTTTTTGTLLPSFKLSDIKKHNTVSDAWVTCGGYVHDITSFMNKHPGGVDYLIPHLGADCEEAMQEHDHSSFSYSLLKSYMIGTVEGQKQRQHFGPEESHLRGYKTHELDGAVDFSQPTLPQIHALGDKYWPWLVNRPVCRDNKLTIFPSAILEALSHYPWWYIWVMWLPTISYNVYLGAQSVTEKQHAATALSAAVIKAVLLSLAGGALTWTVAEYVLHRWVFHHEVFTPAGNVFHYFAHGIHHLIPTDSSRLTFPPLFGLAVGTLFFHIFRYGLAGIGLTQSGAVSDNAWWSGFVFGYLMYDTMHYFFHHSDFNNKLFRKLKAAHMNHHYKNEFANFGVSSPLWDLVLGTWDAEAEAKRA